MNGTFKDFADWVVEDNGTVGHTFSNSLIADAMKSKDDLKHLERLAEYIYSGNKERGFWEEKRSAVELSALICSELFEALEGARKPKETARPSGVLKAISEMRVGLADRFQMQIKDTVHDELADTVIRCLDALGFYWSQTTDRKPDLFAYYLDTVEFEANAGHKEYVKMERDLKRPMLEQPTLIAEVHAITRALTNATVQHNEDEFIVALLATIYYVGRFADAKGINLAAHIKAKLLYNATRPYKHGKKF